MKEIEFRKLVSEMLGAQKRYFKTRTHDDLMKAKELEAKVRKELILGPDITAEVAVQEVLFKENQ